eukprot:CAMPEP_0183743474 /NCGR_PEP_ID=MMETSP0737-20130205/65237_1 /TAXON_ID=385413 /ORGANISM="Thalassiosira miniscula, Strain CCMP1093" /LENGTH=822 /DNA_ID=CAMNT_0025979093 /DNA_START=49 /DNA_END=2514 /DNA_ORIENTATION=-
MRRWILHVVVAVVAAIAPSVCQARTVPLASTAPASSARPGSRSGSIDAANNGPAEKKKRTRFNPSLSMPKVWGRSNGKQSEPPSSSDGDDTSDPEKGQQSTDDADVKSGDDGDGSSDGDDTSDPEKGQQSTDDADVKSGDDGDGKNPVDMENAATNPAGGSEGGADIDEKSSTTSTDADETVAEPLEEKKTSSQPKEDGKIEMETHPLEAQSSNQTQTRSGIIYIAPPVSPMKKTSSQPKEDGKIEMETHPLEAQSSNQTQTRSGIIYIAPPVSPMMPQHQHHARPMPYPFVPQHQHHPHQHNNNRSPSLLSSILSILLPRPQNMPPSPYGPPSPMPPSSPYGPGPGNNALLSLLLRLALFSAGTLVLDLLGLGAHSDAFLPTPAQHYTFERINDRYRRDGSALRQALESPPPGIGKRRWKRAFGRRRRDAVGVLTLSEIEDEGGEERNNNHHLAGSETTTTTKEPPSLTNGALYNRTVIIVEMKPDARVGNGIAEQLRDTVTFLIEQHRDHVDRRRLDAKHAMSSRLFSSSKFLPSSYFSSKTSFRHRHRHRTPNGIRPALGTEMEIVLFLDSPGGTVQDYGLASSHLWRLRNEPHVTLSVCVDRVAASGGYMMACQATPGHLFAAPFAMVGSIGVLMETVNVNEVLKRYGVKPLVIKAGKNKAPLKTLGEVTQEELKMAQDDADVIHEAFQRWVTQSRPNVAVTEDWIEKVCTGSVFLGQEACNLGLVDRVLTSDQYIAEKIAAGDRVLRLIPYRGPQFGLKISPLDLLLSGLDAEGRAKISGRIRRFGRGALRHVAPLFRVGATVGILNHLASLHYHRP